MNHPDENWTLEQLGQYIVAGLDKVTRLSRRTSVETWRVGHALSIVQHKTKPFGQWTKWLAKHDIARMTAWEAIRLHESATEEEIAELTITEAKTKFGIYPEFAPDEDEPSSAEPKEASEQDAERQVNTLYRRLKGAAEVVSSLQWERDLLYSTEVDEMLQFCRQVVRSINQQRKKVPQPKRENTKRYLAHLRSL
jgi:hypothetical protein